MACMILDSPYKRSYEIETILETDTKVMRLGSYWLHFHQKNWFNDLFMKVWYVPNVPWTKHTKIAYLGLFWLKIAKVTFFQLGDVDVVQK